MSLDNGLLLLHKCQGKAKVFMGKKFMLRFLFSMQKKLNLWPALDIIAYAGYRFNDCM